MTKNTSVGSQFESLGNFDSIETFFDHLNKLANDYEQKYPVEDLQNLLEEEVELQYADGVTERLSIKE